VELQSQLEELRKQGLGLASISYDPVETLAGFAKQQGITFPMLADPGSATIKRFGILNPVPEWALGPDKDDPDVKAEIQKYVSVVGASARMLGIAFPGTFILDPQGRVKQRFFEDFYIERNTVSNLLIKTGGSTEAPIAATKVSTAHLDLTAYPSIPTLAPGDRFSVVLDVQPHAQIHVYAPGAEANGYRVISFALDPDPVLRALPVQYPASEIYFFQPLNERVPVFQKPFRLVQELVLGGDLQAQAALRGKQNVTVKGALQYQACNDKECFTPVSVPLSWTMTLRPLIRQQPGQQKQ
jgi:peroxiredoxin